MGATENSILERLSIDVSSLPLPPSLQETSVAAAPLCSCQQGHVRVYVCVRVCVPVCLYR